jgi:hypothetical protein
MAEFNLGAIVAHLRLDTSQFKQALSQSITATANLSSIVKGLGAAALSTLGPWGQLVSAIAAGNLAARTLEKAFTGAASAIRRAVADSISVTEDFEMGIIRLAAAITSMAEIAPSELPKYFQSAMEYARELYQQILLLDAQFSGTAEQLQEIVLAFSTFGILVDLTNEKHRDAIRGFGEALRLYSQGLSITRETVQFLSAVLFGLRDEQDRLTRQLGLTGAEGEKVRKIFYSIQDPVERISYLMEVIREHTKGFAQAGQVIQRTMMAVKTTLETTFNIMRRAIAFEAWKIWVSTLERVREAFRDAQGVWTSLSVMFVQQFQPVITQIAMAASLFMDTIVKMAPAAIKVLSSIANAFTVIASALTMILAGATEFVGFIGQITGLARVLDALLDVIGLKWASRMMGITPPTEEQARALLMFAEGRALEERIRRLSTEQLYRFLLGPISPRAAQFADQELKKREKLTEELTKQIEELDAAEQSEFEREMLRLRRRTEEARRAGVEERVVWEYLTKERERLEQQRAKAVEEANIRILQLEGHLLEARLRQAAKEADEFARRTGDYAKALELRRALEQEALREHERNVQEAQQRILQLQGRAFESRMIQIRQETEEIRRQTGDRVLAEQYYTEAVKELQRDLLRTRMDVYARILEMEGRVIEARRIQVQMEVEDIARRTQSVELARRFELARLEQIEREHAERRQRIWESAYSAITRASQDAAVTQTMQAIEAFRRQQEELQNAARQGLITWDEYNRLIREINSATVLQLAQSFRAMIEERINALKRLANEHANIMMQIAQIDIRVARLRAEIAGKTEIEILRAEEQAILEAARNEQIALEDRIRLAQQLQNTINQRIRLLDQEGASYADIQSAINDLNRARSLEIELLMRRRRELVESAAGVRTEMRDIQLEIERLHVVWSRAADAIRNAMYDAARAMHSWYVEWLFPSIIKGLRDVANYAAQVGQAVRSALDPTLRRSPSLVDRVTAGLAAIERAYVRTASKIEQYASPLLTSPVEQPVPVSSVQIYVNGVRLEGPKAMELLEMFIRDPVQRYRVAKAAGWSL